MTAGVPPVGRAGTSVGQQFVQPLAELEDDREADDGEDEALEADVVSLPVLVVSGAVVSDGEADGSLSGLVSSASVPRSSRRFSVNSGSGVSFSRLLFTESRTLPGKI